MDESSFTSYQYYYEIDAWDIALDCMLVIGDAIWIILYFYIIYKLYRNNDKLYVPMAGLSVNIAWEFIFSFIVEVILIQKISNIIWFILDGIILLLSWKNYYNIHKSLKPIWLIIIQCSSYMALGFYFNWFFIEFTPQDPGTYSAYMANFFLSFLYLFVGNQEPDVIVAIMKMVGSLATVFYAVSYLDSSFFMLTTYTLVAIMDLSYVFVTIYKNFLISNKKNSDEYDLDIQLEEIETIDQSEYPKETITEKNK